MDDCNHIFRVINFTPSNVVEARHHTVVSCENMIEDQLRSKSHAMGSKMIEVQKKPGFDDEKLKSVWDQFSGFRENQKRKKAYMDKTVREELSKIVKELPKRAHALDKVLQAKLLQLQATLDTCMEVEKWVDTELPELAPVEASKVTSSDGLKKSNGSMPCRSILGKDLENDEEERKVRIGDAYQLSSSAIPSVFGTARDSSLQKLREAEKWDNNCVWKAPPRDCPGVITEDGITQLLSSLEASKHEKVKR